MGQIQQTNKALNSTKDPSNLVNSTPSPKKSFSQLHCPITKKSSHKSLLRSQSSKSIIKRRADTAVQVSRTSSDSNEEFCYFSMSIPNCFAFGNKPLEIEKIGFLGTDSSFSLLPYKVWLVLQEHTKVNHLLSVSKAMYLTIWSVNTNFNFVEKTISDITVYHIMSRPHKNIRELSLTGCVEITDHLLFHLNEFSTLTSLNLSGTRVTDIGISRVTNINLKHLDITNCIYIGTKGVKNVCQNLIRLETLKISENASEDKKASKLVLLDCVQDIIKLNRLKELEMKINEETQQRIFLKMNKEHLKGKEEEPNESQEEGEEEQMEKMVKVCLDSYPFFIENLTNLELINGVRVR